MARQPRLALGGYAHYIIQRGRLGQAIFHTDDDRVGYLSLVEQTVKKLPIALHAYVLLDDQVHWLLTPETAQALASFMKILALRYTKSYNYFHKHKGSIWEGRYRSTILQPELYLLASMSAIDLSPLRTGLVADPADYTWSSYRHYAGGQVQPFLTAHPALWSLGNTPFAREKAYQALVASGQASLVENEIIAAATHGWALGDAPFIETIQKRTSRRVMKRFAGRPAKVSSNPASLQLTD